MNFLAAGKKRKTKTASLVGSPAPRSESKSSKRKKQPFQSNKDSPALENLPPDVVARVAGFMNRPDLNNFRETCTRVKGVVDNPGMVVWPWPPSCPFEALHDHRSVNSLIVSSDTRIIFSNDGSRVAVLDGYSWDFDDDAPPLATGGTLEVWDRTKGLIGQLACHAFMGTRPAFSPDNQLLLVQPNHDEDAGLRICQLPSREQKGPMIVSHHRLAGAQVNSIAFLNNTTVFFMDGCQNGVKVFTINRRQRRNNRIGITELKTILTDRDHPPPPNHNIWRGHLSTFYGKRKEILAFVYDMDDRVVVIQDRKRNVAVVRPILNNTAGVRSLAFSRDGSLLLVGHQRGGISAFDCSVDMIEDIGQSKVVYFDESDGYYQHISLSPNISRIAVLVSGGTTHSRHASLRIIDIQSGALLSDGWNKWSWKILVSK